MFKRSVILTLWVMLLSCAAMAAPSPRVVYNLNEDWKFYYASDIDGAKAEIITLPHTWNRSAAEGDYLRTTANYMRSFTAPEAWRGRRLFLRFGGVQSVADVFVNGSHVGSHEGGFTAFTVEITESVRLGAENLVRVVVSNAMRSDVLPVSSDMNLAGGIYRDVELMVTGKDIISPLDRSTDGVYVVQQSVTTDEAKGVVRVALSSAKPEHLSLVVRMVGPDGYEAFRRVVRNMKPSTEGYVDVPFEIPMPELWSPECPNLYGVEVALGDEDEPDDKVSLTTGFRTIAVSDDNRLCINGVPVSVRGVNLAHDREDAGSVLTAEDIDRDLALMDNMGVNAVRSLLGPHIQHLYDRSDSDGRLVWVDMPFSRSPLSFTDICYYPTVGFSENGMKQLEEVVCQNFNHPSVVMWGLFEQVWQRGEDVVGYVRMLNDHAHALDPSRLTVGCSSTDGEINFVTDLVVFRQSVGYAKGSVEDVAVWCRQLATNRAWRTMRYGVCYGEEGNIRHLTERVERAQYGTRHFPERRQTLMHERYASIIREADIFWGMWLSSMFDYASAYRPYGLNQSGIVGYDHTTPKDAYYLYRTLWNGGEPTLHITNRRWRERREALQRVDIYSSVGEPLVVVSGDTVVVTPMAEGIYRADSLMLDGRVEIIATDTTGVYSDRVELFVGKGGSLE